MRNLIHGMLLFQFLAGCAPPDPYLDKELLTRLPEEVDFNFHVRPILADRCFSCHGPDEAARKGDLRLDEPASAFAVPVSGRRALQAGKPEKSGVWHRIYSTDPERRMPPPESNLTLTEYEKALITRWIRQGAEYKPHWAFLSVTKPDIPEVKEQAAAPSPIDRFVLAELERNGLTFSPESDKEHLLRRVSFDLTGLPPTLQEIDGFLADDDPRAFEKVVDRLLASDAFGERMAMDWLDLARYADSQGLHSDGWRSMYPWRDWVISAFNENMPFDQFLTWQLAGDLLPDPGRDQLVATGFNRNHKITAEGGVVEEEYRAEYVHDRVATTATAFLGLTMECARCHDHKYDPVGQEDYYRFFAFFNQVEELGMSGDDGNAGPNLLLPAPATATLLAQIQMEMEVKKQELEVSETALADQIDFIKQLTQPAFSLRNGETVHLPFERITGRQVDQHPQSSASDGVEVVATERGGAVELNAEYEFITIREQGLFDQYQPFSASVWIKPQGRSTSQTIAGNSGQKGTFWRGWDFLLDSLNRLSLRLIHALPHDAAAVYTLDSVPVQQWTHVAFSYDGSGMVSGMRLYVNGKEKKTGVRYKHLLRSIHPIAFSKEKTGTPLRLGKSYRAFTGEYGIFSGRMDDFRLFSRQLSPLEMAELAGKTTVRETLENYRQSPSPEMASQLLETWRARFRHPLEAEIAELAKRRVELLDTVPEVMIMEELGDARPTFILNRGNYDQPGARVFPGTPEKILPFPDSLPANRLGLARWLLDPAHPLTSRVTVNRFWQQFFGRGLVGTPHDFGLQGSLPTHPQLLDWLAFTFMESGWDVKALLKTIVMSAAYRQRSAASVGLREQDPENLLLARGPSYRLPAEMIRDNALAAAGLLNRRIGGPSVKPVQPEGLWLEKTSSTHLLRRYEPDSGAARYRRSLYTFVRRTSPHPAMTAFDAPNRSYCVAQRSRTNTPQQALVLLNDPQFVEAARTLAERLLREKDAPENHIRLAFRLLTGLKPSAAQLGQLLQLYQEELSRFRQDRASARRYVSIGQYPRDATVELEELASMSLVVNTIANFDEFYMKR